MIFSFALIFNQQKTHTYDISHLRQVMSGHKYMRKFQELTSVFYQYATTTSTENREFIFLIKYVYVGRINQKNKMVSLHVHWYIFHVQINEYETDQEGCNWEHGLSAAIKLGTPEPKFLQSGRTLTFS